MKTAAVRNGTRMVRSMINALASVAVLAMLGAVSTASALTLNGGPVYVAGIPGGGSCSTAGTPCAAGGATVSCSGLSPGGVSALYFGIRNDQFAQGETMSGTAGPTAGGAAIYRHSSGSGAVITYVGNSNPTATTIFSALSVGGGTFSVATQMKLTLLSGSASIVATGGTPASNSNADIGSVFQVTSSSFAVRIDVQTTGGTQSCPGTFDPTNTRSPGSGLSPTDQSVSRVDLGFYWQSLPTPTPTNTPTNTPTRTPTFTNTPTNTPTSTPTSTPTATPTPTQCGNGTVNGGEDCDEGGLNGSPSSCCSSSCTFNSNGTVCRPDAGECDVQEVCDGGSATCPADVFEPAATACGDPSDTDCSNPDGCDGSGTCDPNDEITGFACGDPSDTDCDDPDTCDGSGSCDVNNESIATLCRAASVGQLCDEAEFCDGLGSCPADGVKANGTVCRTDAGDCDVQEVCDGSSSACPADAFEPAATACGNPSDTDCTDPDSCDGAGACLANNEPALTACGNPSDTDCSDPDTCDGAGACDLNNETSGTSCTDDGETCTVDECNGLGTCTHPAGNSGAECRAASAGQLCDEAEVCDGTSPTCPADGVKANGTVCRADAGDCDVQEVCDGSSSACPADVFEPAATACGDPSDTDCTDPDTCNGSGTCLGNHEPNTTQCRAASVGQACDEAENCDGAGNCPADGVKANGTECRASTDLCDAAEECDGSSSACPADGVEPNGTICRADTGVCDVAETCNGVATSCPADGFEADGTGCSNGTFCDGIDTCQSGTCTSPGTPCGFGETCNEGADACFMGGCPLTVDTCRTAVKSKLLIKDKADNNKDKLIWKWIKGQSTDQAEFANPETTADYAFCVYAGATPTLIAHAEVPPNATLWDPISTKGYKYKDKPGTQDGIQKVLVKGSTTNKSKALLKGKGALLPDVTLPIAPVDLPVIAQLRNNSSGICWGASFASPIKNDAGQFKGKN